MKLPILLCAAAFSLTGCTTVGSMFAQGPREPTPADLADSYVPVAARMPSDFCARVGVHAREEALRAGFDAATQERMALVSGRQCQSFSRQQVAAL